MNNELDKAISSMRIFVELDDGSVHGFPITQDARNNIESLIANQCQEAIQEFAEKIKALPRAIYSTTLDIPIIQVPVKDIDALLKEDKAA